MRAKDIRLHHLPDDAIENIALHLPIPALFQLSLTCKSIANVVLSEGQFERRLLSAYAVDIKVRLV
jgi:hypothetical protein